MNEQLATTENLLHPRQIVELRDTKARLEGMLAGPEYVRAQLHENGAVVQNQVKALDKLLD